MKIGVVGPGAVGGYYGGKLARAGHDVYFLLRSDFERVAREGVRIHSPEGDFAFRPTCARESSEIGICDLVLVALKTTANVEFPRLLQPLAGRETIILTLQNGLGNEEALARLFPAEQIMGGLCFVCLNRIAPGVIQHLAHGKIELGEFLRPPRSRTRQVAEWFRQAGVPCAVRENLDQAHWEKLVWNIPFNGLSVASRAGFEAVRSGRFEGIIAGSLTTDRLLGDPKWFGLVKELMLEIIAAANALELKIAPDFADEQIERTRVMGAYKPSTLVDHLRGQPIELEALFLEPLRRAEARGCSMPRLRALGGILKRLDQFRE